MAQQTGEAVGGVLDQAQLDAFQRDGYLVVEGVLDPKRDLAPVLEEYGHVLDVIVEALTAGGELRERHDGLPFLERLDAVVRESGRQFPLEFDISLGPVSPLTGKTMHTGPATLALLTNPRLLDVVESLVGPEILSNPIQHARIKPPLASVRTAETAAVVATPWHQDQAVHTPDADDTGMVTVWVAVTDATKANGCLRVLPGSHRHGLLPHQFGPTAIAADPDTIPPGQPAAAEVSAGGVVLMTSRTLHGSYENTTDDQVRFSFDIRYQPVGRPTGRAWYPGFVARSRRDPSSVLTDAAAWTALWDEAAARLVQDPSLPWDRWSAAASNP
jgi:phytanoyl-CoA hydroxylase